MSDRFGFGPDPNPMLYYGMTKDQLWQKRKALESLRKDMNVKQYEAHRDLIANRLYHVG